MSWGFCYGNLRGLLELFLVLKIAKSYSESHCPHLEGTVLWQKLFDVYFNELGGDKKI